MLEGQLIYRDFDHFTLPATHVGYLALFKLFGVRAWVPQAMLIVIGVTTAWLCFEISKTVLGARAALLPSLLFLTLPFSSFLDATHHWYSTLAATAAVAVVTRARTMSRLAWAGAFWGVATCFAQSMVMGLGGLILFLVWERRQKHESRSRQIQGVLWASGSFLSVVAIFNVYFIWKAGLSRFAYYTVIFVAKYYRADRYNTWTAYLRGRPSLRDWWNWADLTAWPLIHLILPLVYVLFLMRFWRDSRKRPDVPWERLMLLNITGLAALLTVVSAPAYNRLYTVSLPALVLLVWLLDSTSGIKRAMVRGLWILGVALIIAKPIVAQFRWRGILDLPTGRSVFFSPALYEHTKWVFERTRPGDYFFGHQVVGFALQLRNPGRVAFVRPTDYTRPEQVEDLVGGLEKHHVRFVSWYAGLDETAKSAEDHLDPLREYLRNHYRVAAVFPDGAKVWQRQE
jgi:hypothetical protein